MTHTEEQRLALKERIREISNELQALKEYVDSPAFAEYEDPFTEFEKEFDNAIRSYRCEEFEGDYIEWVKYRSKKLLALAKKELCLFCDEHLKGFSEGYSKANEEKSYHIPVMPTPPSGWGCDGTHCTNPMRDCINCPGKLTGGGFNTASGTSTLKAEEKK